MKLTYAITVCNEFYEIQRLVSFLLQHKRQQDNIVVLYDEANGDPEVEEYLRTHSLNGEFAWFKAKFNNHFADWKNKLSSLCTGDYIFQIDADEMINAYQCKVIPQVIESNDVDVIMVPRVNTVDGLTHEHIKKWGWNINEYGWVNFPDYQWRIYRNKSSIIWINQVHEQLTGFNTISNLPADSDWSITHHKTIQRQEKQNNFYNKL